MTDPTPDLPIDAYLAGELDPSRAAEVRERLAALPDGPERLAHLLATVRGEHFRARPMPHESAQRLLDRLAADDVRMERTRTSPRAPNIAAWSTRRIGVMIAALVLVAAGIGVTWRGHDAGVAPSAEYQTRAGERVTVRFANGTTMMLAPATTARLSKGTVAVSGEVYFTVAHTHSQPLIVRTANAVVRVLGTKFLVRHYPSDPTSAIVVEDGKVALQSTTKTRGTPAPVILTARMLAQVADSGVTVTRGIAIADYTGWTTGRLVFKDVPLHTIAEALTRAYGVDVTVADSTLAKQRMTMTAIVARHTLPQLLDFISQATGAHCERAGKTFVLRAGPGSPDSAAPRGRTIMQPERLYGR